MDFLGAILLAASGVAGLLLTDGFSKYFEGWEMEKREDEENPY